jgi:hypothetical protein
LGAKGDAVVPAGNGAVRSGVDGRENAYSDFCFVGFPCPAREMNRVTGLISGASCVGLWKNGSLSKKKSGEDEK